MVGTPQYSAIAVIKASIKESYLTHPPFLTHRLERNSKYEVKEAESVIKLYVKSDFSVKEGHVYEKMADDRSVYYAGALPVTEGECFCCCWIYVPLDLYIGILGMVQRAIHTKGLSTKRYRDNACREDLY